MSHVFKTQSLLTITAETGYPSLGAASVTRIKYTKPSGASGYWDATVSGTTLNYSVQPGDINEAGVWKFQSYIEVGGLNAPGKIDSHLFEKPL